MYVEDKERPIPSDSNAVDVFKIFELFAVGNFIDAFCLFYFLECFLQGGFHFPG